MNITLTLHTLRSYLVYFNLVSKSVPQREFWVLPVCLHHKLLPWALFVRHSAMCQFYMSGVWWMVVVFMVGWPHVMFSEGIIHSTSKGIAINNRSGSITTSVCSCGSRPELSLCRHHYKLEANLFPFINGLYMVKEIAPSLAECRWITTQKVAPICNLCSSTSVCV